MLDKIFDTDELPNVKVYEVAHLVVSDYMDKHNCKIDVVAAELGTTTGVLYRQLNQKDTQMTLSIDRIMSICKLTQDFRILEVVSSEFELMIIPKHTDEAKTSDINLLVDMASIENNDVFRVVKQAIADGVITPEEKAAILKEIEEAETANAELKDLVLHTAIKQAKK
jgi:hypothetical protein